MTRHSFLSVVNVVQSDRQARDLNAWLNGLYHELKAQFSDFEFVLVNNHCDQAVIDAAINPLPEELRKNIFLLNLSAHVGRDNALLAGLDRANGDYTVIFEFDFAAKPQLVTQLWEESQKGSDIVYLRAGERRLTLASRWLYGLFYFIMQRWSGLRLDPRAHHTRIISRRALNSLLRLRENSHYLKANYALVGYNTSHIAVEEPLFPDPEATLGGQFRTSLVAELRAHPEWDRVLFPEKYRPKPVVVAAKRVAPAASAAAPQAPEPAPVTASLQGLMSWPSAARDFTPNPPMEAR